MHLDWNFRTPVVRTWPNDYVREVLVEVMEYDEFGADIFIMGRIECQQVMLSWILDDGENARATCDEHSGELEEIYRLFIDPYSEVRQEFQVDALVSNVVVIDDWLLHPSIVEHGQHILAAFIEVFGAATLVIADRETIPLTDKELSVLGFRKAARSQLIYRHTTLRCSYLPPDCEYGIVVDAREEHEEWVLREWDKRR